MRAGFAIVRVDKPFKVEEVVFAEKGDRVPADDEVFNLLGVQTL